MCFRVIYFVGESFFFFLWGGIGDEFKIYLVCWSKICTSMSSGA
jgi:hypothetical protein